MAKLRLALALAAGVAAAPGGRAGDLHDHHHHAEILGGGRAAERDGMRASMLGPDARESDLAHAGPIERYAASGGRGGTSKWERKGDKHLKSAHYKMAAESYKLALKHAPDDERLWDKHRQAFQMDRAIEGYVAKAEALLGKGLHEEAASFLKLAVRLDPRNQVLWRLYERALAENPHVVVVTTEQEAWDSYRRGREVLDGGRYLAAIRYFEPVLAFTKDERLRFYAKDLMAKAEDRVRREYPNLPRRLVDR